jgi:hypothetical protein
VTDQLVDALLTDRLVRDCSFKKKRTEMLTPEQDEALSFAIRNTAKSVRDIVDILRNVGMPISRDTITIHRKGNCPICRTIT